MPELFCSSLRNTEESSALFSYTDDGSSNFLIWSDSEEIREDYDHKRCFEASRSIEKAFLLGQH